MPMITSVASSLKKTINSTQVSSPEETKIRKKKMLDIVDVAVDQFQQNLQAGTVQLKSSLDLERLVRCFLILSGETIDGAPPTSSSGQQEVVETSKISEILNEDDPMVKTLFDKLYNGFNTMNDVDD